MALKDLMGEQRSCPRCNICKWIPIEKYAGPETQACCPAIEKYQFHSYSAGGKIHMCIGINEDRIPMDASVAGIAYKCHFCGACEYSCKAYRPDMDVTDTFDELRIACVENGLAPAAHQKMIKSLAANDDCYGREKEERINWCADTDIRLLSADQTAEYYFYAGNSVLYDSKEAAKAAKLVRLLMSKGMDLVTAGTEEANSGYEAFVLGHIPEAKACAEAVCEQVKASGAKTMIVMDAHSFGTMRNYYPKHGCDLGVEIRHVTEVLADLIADGQITFENTCEKTVTYQDPCYLGRRSDPYKPPFPGSKDTRPVSMSRTGELGVYEAPRDILKAIPGITLTEMKRIRGYAWCCGGGAGVPQAYPELTESTSRARISEAGSTGADILVTACPNCEHVLSQASDGLQVMDILDLVLNEGGAR